MLIFWHGTSPSSETTPFSRHFLVFCLVFASCFSATDLLFLFFHCLSGLSCGQCNIAFRLKPFNSVSLKPKRNSSPLQPKDGGFMGKVFLWYMRAAAICTLTHTPSSGHIRPGSKSLVVLLSISVFLPSEKSSCTSIKLFSV